MNDTITAFDPTKFKQDTRAPGFHSATTLAIDCPVLMSSAAECVRFECGAKVASEAS